MWHTSMKHELTKVMIDLVTHEHKLHWRQNSYLTLYPPKCFSAAYVMCWIISVSRNFPAKNSAAKSDGKLLCGVLVKEIYPDILTTALLFKTHSLHSSRKTPVGYFLKGTMTTTQWPSMTLIRSFYYNIQVSEAQISILYIEKWSIVIIL